MSGGISLLLDNPKTLPHDAINGRIVGRLPLDDEFDTTFADEIAHLEAFNKHHYRPNTYLHKWWARRCGSTFRLILKHLVADETQRHYYAPGGLAGKIILDPMMGGGTTLHEAIRLGANVIGADIDPIPVLQARATLSDIKLVELEQVYHQFHRQLRAALDPYFETSCPHCARSLPAQFVLYGLKRFCACGPVLVVDSAVLRHQSDGECVQLCLRCHRVLQGGESCDCQPNGKVPVIERGQEQCPTCQQAYWEDMSLPYYARYEPLVVVGRCPQHKLFFKSPDSADLASLHRADQKRQELGFETADFAIHPGQKSIHLIKRGIRNYLELFSSRQLLYLQHAIHLLPQFDPLIRLNLALLVSTSLEFNSLLCGYKGKNQQRAGAIRHTFSHHAYSFPYTALENNPVHPRMASGTLHKLFHARIRNGRLWARQPRERLVHTQNEFVPIEGEVDAGKEVSRVAELQQGTHRFLLRQGSSARLHLESDSVDYIVTDPPYYDSVQYSDLAAFFRVWLQKLVPEEANWEYDVQESAVDPHKNGKDSRYTEILQEIFRECYRVLKKENGRFIFTFHHWNPKGWAALTIALQQANFRLVNRYVVHAENPISVHIANMNALTHDAILVLAPADAHIAGEWKRPFTVNQADSHAFCWDCATLLGWMLNQELKTAEITTLWQTALP